MIKLPDDLCETSFNDFNAMNFVCHQSIDICVSTKGFQPFIKYKDTSIEVSLLLILLIVRRRLASVCEKLPISIS